MFDLWVIFDISISAIGAGLGCALGALLLRRGKPGRYGVLGFLGFLGTSLVFLGVDVLLFDGHLRDNFDWPQLPEWVVPAAVIFAVIGGIAGVVRAGTARKA